MSTGVLTCYAMGNKDGWEAFCIDFDLAVEAKTFDEARDLLNQAIGSYIDDAEAEGPEQALRLINRRAPWYVRLRLQLGFLWYWLVTRGRNDDNDQSYGYTVSCPA